VKEFPLSRFSIAMLAFVVLGILAVTTLTQTVPVAGKQVPLSFITLVILGMFAFRTWLHHKRELLERSEPVNGHGSAQGRR
jgi:hypothetical protein